MELIKDLKKVPMGWVRLPIACLIKAPWNYKTDDAEKAKKLTASIKRNGQVQNIIVRDLGKGKFEIANGNHRLDSFQDLKYKDAVAYNMGKVSQAAAERVAIETNEQSFDPDPIKLGQVIEHIMEQFEKTDLLNTMPYSEVDFDALIAAGGFNPETDGVPSEYDPDVAGAPDAVPAAKFLAALGIISIPRTEAERLTKLVAAAVKVWNLGKTERWKIFEKIEAPKKIQGSKSKPLTKKR